MTDLAEGRGPPVREVLPKRVAATALLEVDWHDWLISRRLPGVAIALNAVVRPIRAFHTGLEYKCTTAGVTSGVPYERIKWPVTVALLVTDGTVVWTAQAVSTSSIRSAVSLNAWSADTGLTLSGPVNSDSRYFTLAAAGIDGQTYEVKNTITLANGEINEALILLPVRN